MRYVAASTSTSRCLRVSWPWPSAHVATCAARRPGATAAIHCPITHDVLTDPVRTVDGFVFERGPNDRDPYAWLTFGKVAGIPSGGSSSTVAE